MEIPERIEQAIAEAVAHHLETELGNRGLLLAADRLVEAEAEAAELGARLLTRVVQQCYPISRQQGEALALEFDSERDATRVNAALAFGAATATVLAPHQRGPEGSVELLCATFNLGIGLVDGLCDGDAETGGRLLKLLQGRDLAGAAEGRRARGWLRSELPAPLAADPTVAFTVDIIEAFFEILHAVYQDDARLDVRRCVGAQLDAALAAERQSVERSSEVTSPTQLIECSRRTSVLPFQIIQTLALGDHTLTEPTAGTLLGEAMWRIDDLVDLCQDARFGALNGVLLAATEEHGERAPLATLERLLASTDLAREADHAAESLLAGLQLAGGGRAAAQDHPPNLTFLHFIQQYAGIPPRRPTP